MKFLLFLVIFTTFGQYFASKVEVLYSPNSLRLRETSLQLDDLSRFASLCFGLTTQSSRNFDGFNGYRNFENIPTNFIAFQTHQSFKKSSPFSFAYDSESLSDDFNRFTNLLSTRSKNVFIKRSDFSSMESSSQQIEAFQNEIQEIIDLSSKQGKLGENSAILFSFGSFQKEDSSKFQDIIISAVQKLRESLNEKVVILNINEAESEPLVRKARAPETENGKKNPHNLAYEYSTDFHTAFATIGVTSIVLILVVFGVSVAMWNIDPGRDSIIYRLTAQKMKKDQ